MSTYRIVTNGETFRIQRRSLFFIWTSLTPGGREVIHDAMYPAEYRSVAEAEYSMSEFKKADRLSVYRAL